MQDVSGVELLMNNHQSLKAEIDAREENFNACISLGRDLLNRKHYASSEIEKQLIKLTTERAEMMRRWEDRWEYLQLSEFFYYLFIKFMKRYYLVYCDISSIFNFRRYLFGVKYFSIGSLSVCSRCSCS